jgi:hypothetical protein
MDKLSVVCCVKEMAYDLLFVLVIRWKWHYTLASTYYSITFRAGEEYERKLRKLVFPAPLQVMRLDL